ncbi:redox-regulated ATPase YchF [soil metagenome]
MPRSMARLGIVGFTNSGKTTLFNALTGLGAATAAHPFSTTEPNQGVARVPDPRLEEVARVEGSSKVTPAVLELLDLPALARGGHSSSGQDLARLREVEAIVVVLRSFTDESVPDDGAGIDPIGAAEELLLELAVADHEVFSRKNERLTKEAMLDQGKRQLAGTIGDATEVLAGGEALRLQDWTEDARQAFRDLAPLTLKPTVWVINVDEGATDSEKLEVGLRSVVPPADQVVVLSAKLEEEGAQLSEAERAELFEELGLGECALAAMVRATYQSLGLLSFYTVGPKESRAWTVRAGALAPEAAGRIHSDLERGFIRAEVAPLDDVIAAGGWDAAKRAGVIRVEGKSYQVAASDVLVIRFSV